MKSFKSFLPLLWVLITPHVSASQLHGFVSQGLSYSEGNNWFGQSEGQVSTDNSQLGLNYFNQLSPNTSFGTQALIQKTSSDDAQASLDYLRLNHNAYQNSEGQTLTLSLGRIKNQIGLYNSSRDVPFAHDSSLLPQSIYIDRNRELLLSSDGLGLAYSIPTQHFSHQLNLQMGCPNLSSDQVRIGLLSENVTGDLSCEPSLNAQYMAEDMIHNYKLGLSFVNAKMKLNSTSSIAENGEINIDYWVASAQKAYNRLTLTSEYGLRHMQYNAFGPIFSSVVLPNTDFWAESYYIQAEYAFESRLRGYLRYDVYYTDKDDKSGTQAQNFYASNPGTPNIPAHYFYSKTQTLGMVYDLNESWLLKAEFNKIKGRAVLPYIDNASTGTSENTDLYLISAHYRF